MKIVPVIRKKKKNRFFPPRRSFSWALTEYSWEIVLPGIESKILRIDVHRHTWSVRKLSLRNSLWFPIRESFSLFNLFPRLSRSVLRAKTDRMVPGNVINHSSESGEGGIEFLPSEDSSSSSLGRARSSGMLLGNQCILFPYPRRNELSGIFSLPFSTRPDFFNSGKLDEEREIYCPRYRS